MKFRYLILLVFFLQSSIFFFGQTGYFTLRGKITDSSEPRLVFTNCKIYIYSDSNLVAIAKTDFDGKYQCDQLKPNLSKSLKIKLKYIKGEGVSKEIFVPESQLSTTKKRIQPDKYVEFNYDFCDSLITKNNFLENESIPKLKYFSNAKIILVYSPFDTLLNSITEVRILENSRLLTTIERTDKNVFNIKLPKKINLKNLSVELEKFILSNSVYFILGGGTQL